TPVREPRVAGDDGLTSTAPHEIRIGPTRHGRREACSARRFGGAYGGEGLTRLVPLRGEPPRRLARAQREAEPPGGCEVLAVVEAARALFGVEELAIPLGRVRIRAARVRDHGWHARVRMPDDAAARAVGVEAKPRVLVMQGVVVPPGEKGSDGERPL